MGSGNKRISVQFVTLGGSLGSALSGFQKINTERFILFTSENMRDVGREVKKSIEDQFHVPTEIISIDPFDISDCVTKIIEKATKEQLYAWDKGYTIDLAMNMTGGTNIMASSMLLAAYILSGYVGEKQVIQSAKLFYVKSQRTNENPNVPAEEDELIEVPLPKIFVKDLTEKRQELMRLIHGKNGILMSSLRDLANFSSTSALKRHTDFLEDHELIQGKNEGNEKLLKLTHAGNFLISLMQINS